MKETLLNNRKGIIETDQIRIYKNSFIYEDSILQISNMSLITVAPVTGKSISIWAVIFAIVGFIFLFQSPFWGILLLAAGILSIASTIYYNSTKGYYLRIDMNSGLKYYFSGQSMTFLQEVKDVMIDCMNDNNSYYKIDMGHAQIQNLQIGDGNEMI